VDVVLMEGSWLIGRDSALLVQFEQIVLAVNDEFLSAVDNPAWIRGKRHVS
jgi:hypothetical protein